jgi:predicted dehydrogenase
VAIRIGVVGCGYIAQYTYLPVIARIGPQRAEVVAVFDTAPERVAVAREQFPDAAGYTDFSAFLRHAGGLDLVFNLTPAPLHRDISAQVLETGAHVYTEKPLATTVADAQLLASLARGRGLQLFCAPSTVTTARMVWLRQKIDDGDFGRAHTIKAHIGAMGPAAWREYSGDPRVFYRKDVGPLVDVGVYMLHAITGLFGPVTRVSAIGGVTYPERPILIDRLWGERVSVESPDVYSINLEFEGNRFAHLFASYATPASKAPMFEIYGTHGAASVSAQQWYLGNGTTDLYVADESREGTRGGWTEDVPPAEPLPIDGILESGILHAFDVLETGCPNILDASHATHVLEIMIGAGASIERGEPVAITTRFDTTQ